MTQYGRIPVDKLEILYSKSSGPGGQNVNKLKTKVQIRFNINTADWLPEEVRQAMLTKHKNKFTKDGILLLESQSTRNQLCNERNAIIKLQSIIERSFYKPSVPNEAKRLKIKELEASAKERRRMFKMSRKERKGDPFGYT
ncbi:Peptidyl-tRNA hydrolase ICT1, mitochondrial [Oopsacas minuta]|uniref:Large ribosomal subunit protein mL62 n=1 Tax=Oopsacas minuta TaxID=111878 RepID=A0AAV7K1N9_9METZ|nr:Peptidyl-tRNA hydrolase ICT1, mitochondrial [Oopsacas minuta]